MSTQKPKATHKLHMPKKFISYGMVKIGSDVADSLEDEPVAPKKKREVVIDEVEDVLFSDLE